MLTGRAIPRSYASASAVVLGLVLSPVCSDPCGLADPEVKAWIHGTKTTLGPVLNSVPVAFDPYSSCCRAWGHIPVVPNPFSHSRPALQNWAQRCYLCRLNPWPLCLQLEHTMWIHAHAQIPFENSTDYSTSSRADVPPSYLGREAGERGDVAAGREGEADAGTRTLPRVPRTTAR